MWQPADMSLWSGRVDADGDDALRWHQAVRPWRGEAGLAGTPALLGFACDEGVRRNRGRSGAAAGPSALRRALAGCASAGTVFDAGDVGCEDGELELAQALFGERVAALLDAGAFALLAGGGHEIAWGSFLGLATHLQRAGAPTRLGILNLDAHFDLRDTRGGANSGTPFRQVVSACEARGLPMAYRVIGLSPAANTAALFAFARAHGVGWVEDWQCHWGALAALHGVIDALVSEVDVLCLSVCLDVFSAASAPGVSAPAAPGIDPLLAVALIRHCGEACLRQGTRWLIGEIAELNPDFDSDGRTARLAARLAHELALAGAQSSQPASRNSARGSPMK